MRWTFDDNAGAMYFYLDDSQQPHSQRELSAGLVLDLNDAGEPIGFEVVGLPDLNELGPVLEEVGLDETTVMTILTTIFFLSENPAPQVAVTDDAPAEQESGDIAVGDLIPA